MKKIATVFLLLAMYVAAEECELEYPKIEIRFADSTLWWRNSYSFFGVGPVALQNDEWSYVLEDGYNCEKKTMEEAFLDSNIILSRELPAGYHRPSGINILFIYSLSLKKHDIGDVFKDEFLHWQQCGMLSLTYEEADSLATSLVEPLNDFVKGKIGVIVTDAFVVEGYPGANPTQISQWIEETCAKVQPQSPPDTGTNPNNKEPETPESLQRLKSANMGVVFENHVAHIPEYLRGEKFFIFDMTGKVAQKGFAEETIQLPDSPSILKIGARKPILCK